MFTVKSQASNQDREGSEILKLTDFVWNGQFILTMVRFRNAANTTQSRYGRSSQLAIGENGAITIIGAKIESQRNGTSISAQSGRWNVKNSGLQTMWKNIFRPNSARTRSWVASSGASVHPNTPDHPASPRMIVHAGPNAQFGGFQLGFRRSRYQGPIEVDTAPMANTRMVMIADTIMGSVIVGPR